MLIHIICHQCPPAQTLPWTNVSITRSSTWSPDFVSYKVEELLLLLLVISMLLPLELFTISASASLVCIVSCLYVSACVSCFFLKIKLLHVLRRYEYFNYTCTIRRYIYIIYIYVYIIYTYTYIYTYTGRPCGRFVRRVRTFQEGLPTE